MSATWMRVLPALLAMAWLGGCGGDGPDVTSNVAPPESDRGGSSAPEAPAPRRNADPPASVPKPATKQSDALANADPDDVFSMSDAPNFAIGEDSANTFVAEAREAGVDSTQFATSPSKETNSSSSRPDRSVKLPEGFTALPGQGHSDEGLPLRIRCEKDGAEMVLIPSSISTLGSNEGPANARPQIAVFLEAYYIDQAEVTLAQFQKYRDWSKESKQRTLAMPGNAGSPDDHPVLGVAWPDARNYAQWAGKDLPTEPEWEKAARGPDGFPHPWGTGRPGWSPPRTPEQIDPVMSFRADISPYGVYDMAGNAREWCFDLYADGTYEEATRNGETVVRKWEGPKRGVSDNHRVAKGNGPGWMAWHRDSVHMRDSAPNVGFRCVLRLKSDKDEKKEAGTTAKPKKAGF